MLRAKEWPNKLGYDVGKSEVWKRGDSFTVFTPWKVLLVKYTTTRDPIEAVRLCRAHGLSRQKLDDMRHAEAQELFLSSAV